MAVAVLRDEVTSEEFNGGGMAGIRSEPTIPSHKHGSEFFGQRDVGRIIGGEIVTQLPNPGQ